MALEVKLQVFEGPLDLLLHLIDKNKVDIYDIPIVTITEQYMEYIRHMQHVEAGAAGKVLKINASVGQAVKAGDAVVTIESMKMEIPMVAPKDGTVASIDVAVGDSVEAGQILATLN